MVLLILTDLLRYTVYSPRIAEVKTALIKKVAGVARVLLTIKAELGALRTTRSKCQPQWLFGY